MQEIIYDIELKLPLKTIYVRKLLTVDFLSSGLLINFFKEKTGGAGRFARLQEQFEKKNDEDLNINDEQKEFVETVLSLAIKDYDKIKDDIFEAERILIFNNIIFLSCEKFYDVIEPDKNMLLSCHYLAKNYGGNPWDYLKMPIDQFLFNLFCLNSGAKDEKIQLKKAMKKK